MRAALRRHPFLLLGCVFLLVLGASLFVGRYPEPGWLSPTMLAEDEVARRLVLNLRLPRVLSACLLGMTLAAAGSVLQMIFRNPLVEPGFLGVTWLAGKIQPDLFPDLDVQQEAIAFFSEMYGMDSAVVEAAILPALKGSVE